MTHLHVSAIPNAALLMTHLKIQGCLDGDMAVACSKFLFHKGSLPDQPNAAANHSQNVIKM